MQTERAELAKSFKEKFELEFPDNFSEEEIQLELEKRLGRLLEKNPEEFFQMLYRIDISEKSLQSVLQEPDALTKLAKMVYTRQLDKVKSRLKYRDYFNKDTTDNDLKW